MFEKSDDLLSAYFRQVNHQLQLHYINYNNIIVLLNFTLLIHCQYIN